MKRILVIGTSGSGKSTLAQDIAARLGLPFYPSDHFYWEPGWVTASSEKVRRLVGEVIEQESWVMDGNFDDLRALVWQRADLIIWLDYSLLTVCRQVIGRNLGWLLSGQTTWSGNRMSLHRAFSGIRHTIKSHGLKRKNYPAWLAELSGVNVQRFRTGRETEAWLSRLK